VRRLREGRSRLKVDPEGFFRLSVCGGVGRREVRSRTIGGRCGRCRGGSGGRCCLSVCMPLISTMFVF